MYIEKMDVHRENGCTSAKLKEMCMQTARLFFTVIMALLLMGCPPPVSDNPDDSASGGNVAAQNGANPNAPGSPDLEPKEIVLPKVSAGEFYTMILKTDGALWAFGRNIEGQLGNNRISGATPVEVLTAPGGRPMTGVDQVSAGYRHSMILKKNSDLWAVGGTDKGQLGIGQIGPDAKKVTPVTVLTSPPPGGQPMTGVKQVSAGGRHSMILKTNDTLWAVGANDFGQLGNDTTDTKSIPVQVLIVAGGAGMTEVDQVSAGSAHTMILKKNGELWAVGRNNVGQLGDNTTDNKLIPVAVKNAEGRPMTEVAQVSAGLDYTMILKKNGELWAVGLNNFGQLGDGSTNDQWTPVEVKTADGSAMTGVAQVSAGFHHTMILKKNGELWAVGRNNFGQLGDGSTDDQWTPIEVKTADGSAMTGVAQVSAGNFHTIIVKRDGTLWAVGDNRSGQLGNGKSGDDVKELIPVEITIP